MLYGRRKQLHRAVVALAHCVGFDSMPAHGYAVADTGHVLLGIVRCDEYQRNLKAAFSRLRDAAVVDKLFVDLGPRFKARPGGYTRILHMMPRPGDSAPMALMQLVDGPAPAASASEPEAAPKAAKAAKKQAAPKKAKAKAKAKKKAAG